MSPGAFPIFTPRQPHHEEPSISRDELIHGFWTFEGGIAVNRLRIPGGAEGALLTIGSDGNVLTTLHPTGNLTFSGVVAIGGLTLTLSADTITIGIEPIITVGSGRVLMPAMFEGQPALLLFSDATTGRLGFNIDGIAAANDRLWRVQDLQGTVLVVGDDAPVVAAGALGKVDLTAQTADIASTALSNTPPAGFYEVEVYILTTTADAAAGTQAVVIGWTDNVGATTNTVIAAHSLAGTGRTTGRALVRLASGNLSYSVTNTGGYGTSAYAVYVRVVALG